MTYNIQAACACHIGKLRPKNEDNFYFGGKVLPLDNSGSPLVISLRKSLADPVCFGVFDGMGGEKHGEQAAYIAAQTLREKIHNPAASPGELLVSVCKVANEKICALSTEYGGARIGTTAAILFLHGDRLWVCNIGDSRVYRCKDGVLTQLSQDHTDALYGAAQKRSPMLTQHLGISPREMLIEPYIAQEEIRAGDRYLVCSDGLTDMLTDDEIARCMSEHADAIDCTSSLIKQSLQRGGRDNITVVVCGVAE